MIYTESRANEFVDCVFQLKLASFKEEQLPYRSKAASHVGAAVLVHVARSGQSDAAHR